MVIYIVDEETEVLVSGEERGCIYSLCVEWATLAKWKKATKQLVAGESPRSCHSVFLRTGAVALWWHGLTDIKGANRQFCFRKQSHFIQFTNSILGFFFMLLSFKVTKTGKHFLFWCCPLKRFLKTTFIDIVLIDNKYGDSVWMSWAAACGCRGVARGWGGPSS